MCFSARLNVDPVSHWKSSLAAVGEGRLMCLKWGHELNLQSLTRTSPVLCTYMLRFCFAFSMSFLISGVMLNRSFLGIGKGIIGDRTSSGFFLLREMICLISPLTQDSAKHSGTGAEVHRRFATCWKTLHSAITMILKSMSEISLVPPAQKEQVPGKSPVESEE